MDHHTVTPFRSFDRGHGINAVYHLFTFCDRDIADAVHGLSLDAYRTDRQDQQTTNVRAMLVVFRLFWATEMRRTPCRNHRSHTIMRTQTHSLLLGASLALALFAGYSFRPAPQVPQYTYRQFSTIESVVPGGLGRSRVIISDQGDQEVGKDLMNFYSMVGINFKNIANNDRLIVDQINTYTSEGWELHTVATGVNSGTDKGGAGIFITRYLFRKPI